MLIAPGSAAPWPSGKAWDCKSLIPGSNPGGASSAASPVEGPRHLGPSSRRRLGAPPLAAARRNPRRDTAGVFAPEPEDELALLVETTRGFAAQRLASVLREAEAVRGVSDTAREEYARIGLAGLELPEALGGVALGSQARALVNEELGAADPGAALALDPLGPALAALDEFGGEEALQRFAAPLLEAFGEGARALLVDGRDAALRLEEGRLTGTVPWVPADRVDLLVWLGEAEAAVVTEGIALERLRGAGLRAAGASALTLDAVPIAAHWRGADDAGHARARARVYVASLLLGVLRAACDFSRAYAQQREAFGRPIAHHQALAFLITDMQMALDGARMLVHEAAWRLDEGEPAGAAAAGAFAECIEASRLIGPAGVQILGGHGFMQDYPVEKYMREGRVLASWLGGLDAAREDAAHELCGEPGPVALLRGER